MQVCINQGDRLKYCKADGTVIWEADWILEPHHYWRQYGGHRGQIKAILDYAQETGIKVEFGDRVVQYVDGDKPSVVTASGKTFAADIVVAADGPVRLLARRSLGCQHRRTRGNT